MKFRIFFILFFFFGLVFSLFDTPWEYREWKEGNPSIYKAKGVELCDVAGLYSSYKYLNLEEIDRMSLSNSDIKKAISLREKLEEKGDVCAGLISRLTQTSLYEKWQRIKYSSLSCLPTGTSYFGWKHYHCINPIIAPGAVVIDIVAAILDVSADLLDSILHDDKKSCKEFFILWKKAMSYSVNSLSYRYNTMLREKNSLEREYNRLIEDTGICSPNSSVYFGECAEIDNLLDKEVWNSVLNLSNSFNEKLNKKGPPDTSDFFNLYLFYINTTDALKSSKSKIKDIKEKAERKYLSLHEENTENLNSLEEELSLLSDEDLQLINEGPAEDNQIPISQRFLLFSSLLNNISLALKEDDSLFYVADKGYLKTLIERESMIELSLVNAKEERDSLLSSATQVVESKRARAEEAVNRLEKKMKEIWSTIPEVWLQKLNSFKSDLSGYNGSLGKRYVRYKEILGSATSMIADLEERGEILRAGEEAAEEFREFLDRAKKDGFDVSEEEKLFNKLYSLFPDNISMEIEKLRNRILTKARALRLEEKRKKVYSLLTKLGDEYSDLRAEVEELERGVVFGNTFDYISGMGKLHSLNKKYLSILSQLEDIKSEILNKYLSVKFSINTKSLNLFSPSNISASLEVFNPTSFSSSIDKPINVITKVPFSDSDLVNGKERVRSVVHNGNRLSIYFNGKIEPKESLIITFNKEFQPIDISLKSSYVYSYSNCLGNEEKEYLLSSVVDFSNLFVGADVDEAFFDSLSVPVDTGFIGVNGLNGKKHTLRIIKREKELCEISQKPERIESGPLETIKRYVIEIIPYQDIDVMHMFVDDYPQNSVSEFNVFSLSGERIKNIQTIDGFGTSFDILDLKKDSKVMIEIELKIENLSSLVESRLREINSSLSSDLEDEFSLAWEEHISGRDKNASAILDRIERELEKRKRETEKLTKSIQKEWNRIKTEFDELNSLNYTSSPLSQKLSERKDYLSSLLSEESNTTDYLNMLKAVDKNWKRKEISSFLRAKTKEFNKLKADYAKAGFKTIDHPLFLDVERKIARLSAAPEWENALSLEKAMDKLKEKIDDNSISAAFENLSLSLSSLEARWKTIQKLYSSLYEDEITKSYLRIDPSALKGKLSLLKNKISKKTGFESARSLLSDVKEEIDIAEEDIDSVKKIAFDSLDTLENAFNSQRDKISKETRKFYEDGIMSVKKLIEKGDYPKAIRTAESLTYQLGEEEQDLRPIIVILSTIFLTLALLYYYFNFYRNKPKEPKKVWRKIKKAEDY